MRPTRSVVDTPWVRLHSLGTETRHRWVGALGSPPLRAAGPRPCCARPGCSSLLSARIKIKTTRVGWASDERRRRTGGKPGPLHKWRCPRLRPPPCQRLRSRPAGCPLRGTSGCAVPCGSHGPRCLFNLKSIKVKTCPPSTPHKPVARGRPAGQHATSLSCVAPPSSGAARETREPEGSAESQPSKAARAGLTCTSRPASLPRRCPGRLR